MKKKEGVFYENEKIFSSVSVRIDSNRYVKQAAVERKVEIRLPQELRKKEAVQKVLYII